MRVHRHGGRAAWVDDGHGDVDAYDARLRGADLDPRRKRSRERHRELAALGAFAARGCCCCQPAASAAVPAGSAQRRGLVIDLEVAQGEGAEAIARRCVDADGAGDALEFAESDNRVVDGRGVPEVGEPARLEQRVTSEHEGERRVGPSVAVRGKEGRHAVLVAEERRRAAARARRRGRALPPELHILGIDGAGRAHHLDRAHRALRAVQRFNDDVAVLVVKHRVGHPVQKVGREEARAARQVHLGEEGTLAVGVDRHEQHTRTHAHEVVD